MSSKLSKGTIGVCLFILSAAFFITPQAVYASVIALPPPCTQAEETGGYLFDSFEEAEYVNGFLVIHLKHKTPYNDGRDWVSMMRLYDGTCDHKDTIQPPGMPLLNSKLAVGTIGYSVRFSSETHYDIWSDDTNTIQSCLACSVDIPETLPNGNPIGYVQFRAFVDGGASRHTTHLYAIKEPAPPVAECCSSIAFLPGLKASRLYTEGALFENTLWEPNRDLDVQKLAMTEDGKSIDENIYTYPNDTGVIDQAFNAFENFYFSFLSDLHQWKNGPDPIIHDYAVLPYDWRVSFDDMLSNGAIEDGKLYYDDSRPTTTPFIYQELSRLADESPTGKVTVIAHSTGGLLAKKLLADLEDTPTHPYHDLLGKIDTLVLVATPQLGTPQTIAGLLHGDEEELDFPFIGWPNFAKAKNIREVAQNMPSVYTLLPSEMYFDRVRDTTPEGVDLPHTSVVEYGWGAPSVTTEDALHTYLVGDDRDEPATDDLLAPEKLSSQFISSVKQLHNRLDDWTVPDVNNDTNPDFKVVQIAGWGMPETIKGIKYVTKHRRVSCPLPVAGTCTEAYTDHEPVWTIDGDGTVVTPSAVAMNSAETWYVDLFSHNAELPFLGFGLRKNRSHGSIFEVLSLRDLVKSLVAEEEVTPINNISSSKPTFDLPYLRLSLHSPVSLNLYDAEGNHVGISASSTNEQIFINEEIPNSFYRAIGEGKYAGVPATTTPYIVILKGTGSGTFTFNIEEVSGDTFIASTTFNDIPVVANSTITTSVQSAADALILSMDMDSDGVVDAVVAKGDGVSPKEFIGILKGIIKTFGLPDTKEERLTKRIEKLEKTLEKEFNSEYTRKQKTLKVLNDLLDKIMKFEKKFLTQDEVKELVDIIERVREGMVE